MLIRCLWRDGWEKGAGRASGKRYWKGGVKKRAEENDVWLRRGLRRWRVLRKRKDCRKLVKFGGRCGSIVVSG